MNTYEFTPEVEQFRQEYKALTNRVGQSFTPERTAVHNATNFPPYFENYYSQESALEAWATYLDNLETATVALGAWLEQARELDEKVKAGIAWQYLLEKSDHDQKRQEEREAQWLAEFIDRLNVGSIVKPERGRAEWQVIGVYPNGDVELKRLVSGDKWLFESVSYRQFRSSWSVVRYAGGAAA